MATIRGNTQVTLEGKGPLTLRQNDYLATGGEGSVYKVKGMAIKLYTDPDKMTRDGIPEKIKKLAAFFHPYISVPQGLVFLSNKPIGFYMPFAEGEPLSRVFTNDFRTREGFGDRDAVKLVERMRDVIRFAHDHGAILVDPNEFNWLAYLKGSDKPEPRIIDVDSWVIGRMPPTVAIMPSVRDWHTKGFNQLSDWFSWGVVTFQVFTGIHPYKGTLVGFTGLEERMKANASVFSSGVRLNRAVRDFNCIPVALRDWYQEIFQIGKRTIPPSSFEIGVAKAGVTRVVKIITASGSLVFDKLYSKTGDEVVRIWPCGVALLKSGELVELRLKRIIGKLNSTNGEVIKTDDGWLIADWINPVLGHKSEVNGQVAYTYVNESLLQSESLTLAVKSSYIFRSENRLFIVTDTGLTEIFFRVIGKAIIAVGQTWSAMVNSTKWFDGVGIQDALGAMYAIVPFSDKSCAQIRVRELDGLKTVSAKAGNRYVVVIAADKNGEYHKIELVMRRDYTNYQVSKTVVDGPDLNMALLPKGVGATIVDDGELIIFVPTSGVVNKVSDKYITTDIALANWNDNVLYIRKGEVWSVRLK
ncbi:MAG: serine/threonine protein kinase [Candidatus Yanofskybacteria bacterium]|nr:serine/threonine protein kinase [Candidatus Yanofskybacteria bacterium]